MEAKARKLWCGTILVFSDVYRHGVPNKVMSDQGREFINSVNSHLFRITGVKHIISLAYHPQTNGLVERFNQTVYKDHC